MLTCELANKFFRYDSNTGNLYWKIKPCSRIHKDAFVGCNFENRDGMKYYILGLKTGGTTRKYLAHRVVWLLNYGEFPNKPLVIDHVNGDGRDNRLENLRAVTNRENGLNKCIHRKGHLIGTTYNKACKKWRSYTTLKGKTIVFGYYETQEQANRVYLEKVSNVVKP